MTPERVFKVVFVGDSGVGKSSFIHRFCDNSFKEAFSATIGSVRFRIKKISQRQVLCFTVVAVFIQVWTSK